MSDAPSAVFLCNGASKPSSKRRYKSATALEYRADQTNQPNITLQLPRFVEQILHIPNRTLDLLEIAAYVFNGDRLAKRGAIDSLEYHSWSRTLEFVIRVRDLEFWRTPRVQISLADALRFMTGDRQYIFTFEGGHATPPMDLFDAAGTVISPPQNATVALFSGGLDSLAGALDILAQPSASACLVSHESQHGTIRTQRAIAGALTERFSGRVYPFAFRCRLADRRAIEETQRTRSFLYFSVGFSVAQAFKLDELFVFENGYTAFAFPERQDLMNARASRTTHPRTLSLMAQFLSLVADQPFQIASPYRWNTKADVLRTINRHGASDLLTSSVSCSATFKPAELGRQCGKCSQCVERRLAAFAAGLGDIDGSGAYAFDFIRDPIDDVEARTLIIDYLRLARQFAINSEDWFQLEKINELADLVDWVEGTDDVERTARIWALCRRHGEETFRGIRHIREKYDDPTKEHVPNTLLAIIAGKEYVKEPVERMINQLRTRFQSAIPIAFKSRRPEHENQLNDQIQAILASDTPAFEREFPVVRFGTATTVPDHSCIGLDLYVEAKLVRQGSSQSKLTDQLAADTVKYGKHRRILFVIYDPERAIVSDNDFAAPFLTEGRTAFCFVR